MSKHAKAVSPQPASPSHVRSRLGRGLSSLLGPAAPAAAVAAEPREAAHVDVPVDPPVAAPGHSVKPHPRLAQDIPVDHIAPNPYQPRRTFDPEALSELAASIANHGVLQPLLVVPAADPAAECPYTLIAGERRLRAARQAGLTNVPCIIRQATGREMLEWSLIENIQRADLNPIERAHAYRDYMDRFGLTQAEVAERTGQARASVANYIRLLDLCNNVQQFLLDGSLTFGHARALAALAGQSARQTALAQRALRMGLSVRQLERLVSAPAAGEDAPAADRPRRAKPPYLVDVEQRLAQAVGNRVTIHPGRAKNTGRIVIDYYSLDDFDRIAAALGLAGES